MACGYREVGTLAPASFPTAQLLQPAQSFGRPCSYLPEKGAARRGILKGASVRKWRGCTLEGDGPPRPSGSTETMAAVAAMVMVGLLLTGFRLLWRPPAEEGQAAQRGDAQWPQEREAVSSCSTQAPRRQEQTRDKTPFLEARAAYHYPKTTGGEFSKCRWSTERTHSCVTSSESQH